MTKLQEIKLARAECRESVEGYKGYPIVRCGGWALSAEHNDTEINNALGNGAITLKEINRFKDDDYPEGTEFHIRGQYDAHSHIDMYHEDFDINYDATESWAVEL